MVYAIGDIETELCTECGQETKHEAVKHYDSSDRIVFECTNCESGQIVKQGWDN